jgi:hypothetical protein
MFENTEAEGEGEGYNYHLKLLQDKEIHVVSLLLNF